MEKQLKDKEEDLKKQIADIQTKVKEIRRKRRPLLQHLSTSDGAEKRFHFIWRN
jgi:phage shock protein A